MSFWLDDDEDDPWSSSQHQEHQHPDASQQVSVYASQQESQFSCDNCGGTECYHDGATGTDVCSSCFTQSQQAASQEAEADWDDVVGLAARTAGGQIVQQRRSATATSDRKRGGSSGRTKRPLEELDTSVPLPDTAICLKGMQRVLQQCVRIAVTQLLPKEPGTDSERKKTAPTKHSDDDNDNDNDSEYEGGQRQDLNSDQLLTRGDDGRKFAVGELAAVKELWLSYLRAWADGAEFYGTKYPHIRFSFRDCFLGHMHASKLLRQHLVHQVAAAADPAMAAGETDPKETNNGKPPPAASRNKMREQVLDESGSDDEKAGAASELDDDDDEPDEDVITELKVGFRGSRAYPNKVRLLAIRQVIQAHTPYRRKGYKEAALYIRPSMTMAAALVWLALTKHREANATVVTSHDVCHWIATGQLPLMTAFQNLLTRRLQRRLEPVAPFFRMEKPLDPSELETMATNLCVACRLRVQSKPIKDDDDDDDDKRNTEAAAVKHAESAVIVKHGRQEAVRFWSVSSLPRILAQLVANMGLDQGVLDRTLTMAGFFLEDPSKAERKKRNEPPADPSATTRGPEKKSKREGDKAASTLDPPKLPVVVQAEQLSRMDELLGLIAIACQLDPQWRTWTYCRPKGPPPAAPWNESQFRLLSNGPAFNSYLDFVEQHVFPDGDGVSIDNRDNRFSMLPQEYFDAVGSLANERKLNEEATAAMDKHDSDEEEEDDQVDAIVRPCYLLAGGRAPKDVEVTNLTFRRPPNMIEEWNRQGRPQKPKKARTNRRRNKDLDAMLLLPMHDFRQADRAASDWIPDNCPDADQDRLLQFLAFSADADPEAVRRSMVRMLSQRAL